MLTIPWPAFADCSCEHVKLVEKMSILEILQTGLITSEKQQKELIKTLKPELEPNQDVFIYVSQKYGSGGGRFSILQSNATGNNIVVDLVFKIGVFEAGVSSLNQRVLFLQVHEGCQIDEVSVVKRD